MICLLGSVEVASSLKDTLTTCLLAVGKFPNTVSGLIHWALSTVETWCNEVGLSANPDKTGLVAFTRRRKLEGLFEPRLFGVPLKLSMSDKYLGVTLDCRLTWKEHSESKARKAQNLVWACRRSFGARWGLGPKVVHWLDPHIKIGIRFLKPGQYAAMPLFRV
jgi:hypothetical protein